MQEENRGKSRQVHQAWASVVKAGRRCPSRGKGRGEASVAVPPIPTFPPAGAVAAVVGFAMTLVTPPLQLAGLSGGTILGVLGTMVLSGAVLGGWLCKFLGDRLLAIPAVRNFLGTPSA